MNKTQQIAHTLDMYRDGVIDLESSVKSIENLYKRKPKVDKPKISNMLIKDVLPEHVPSDERMYFEIAQAFRWVFLDNLLEVNGITTHVQNARYSDYVNPIRLMMCNDGVTREQLITVWKFLQKNDFWKTNILSTRKLREQFTKLFNQAQKESYVKSTKTGTGSISTEYKQTILDRL